jgi:hypothetical protein
MRFRRSVRLCKGISLNFSGSGVTMSLGIPGASVTFGKSGAYVNYGIPGTGLYNRKKITGSSPKYKQARNISDNLIQYSYDVDIADNGQTSIVVYDSMGNRITNSSIISKIRKSDVYKAKVEELIRKKRDSINSQSLQFIRIYKQSEKLVNFDDIRDSYEKLCNLPNPENYFDIPLPLENEIRVKLEKEAEAEIKSILFWTNAEKRKAYVEEKFPSVYKASIDKWNALKAEFVESELTIRNAEKERLEKLLQTNISDIYIAIDEVLENITLPVDFSVNYEIEDRVLYIDLDLPEIEDMPTDKVSTLTSGNIRIKQKSTNELYGDYAICVCGMSYFFASLLFNTTPEIDNIVVSGYTQRENQKLGRIEDQYVYSVWFDRKRFGQLDFALIDPIEMLYSFPHNIKLSKSFKLETIDIKAPLANPILKDSAQSGAKTNISKPIVAASTEEYVTLYREYTGEEVKVTIPSGSILVEIPDSDRTIYCLDSDVFLHIEYYKDTNGKRFIIVNKAKWQKAVDEMSKRLALEKDLALTASLNNDGIELEKNGKENDAVIVYEKNVARRCTARHSYDRLLVIYRKRKDIDNELRIAKLASAIFPNETKYQKRISGLTSIPLDTQLPIKAEIHSPTIKHGDLFEQKILELPEFDFYNGGGDSNANKVGHTELSSVWEIQCYFKKLIESADLAESKKDYENAAAIYEQIIGENYWMPTPCDRLIKIYAKAKLIDDEIRVLRYGIGHFTKLRKDRLDYVKQLAQKYNAVDFLNQRIESGGKITYYNGVFELYNPFPIVEKWEERLKKKLK